MARYAHSSFIFIKKKPDSPFTVSHGHPVPSIRLWRPRYPVDLGSVAFRSTIARGLT
jgi:hypothetical protein